MPQTTPTTTGDPVVLSALQRAARQLAEAGLLMEAFDRSHAPLLERGGDCEFCRRFCGPGGPCAAGREELVQQVWLDAQPRHQLSLTGCVQMALPVAQRRRQAAVALVCFHTPQTGQGEDFARLCDRLHVDRRFLADQARRRPVHSAQEAPHLLRLAGHLIAQALENAVAQQELATLSGNLGSTYEELSLLYRLSGAMMVSTAPDDFFARLCRELQEVMEVGAIVALVPEQGSDGGAERIIRAGEVDLTDAQLRALARRHIRPAMTDPDRGLIVNGFGARAAGPAAVQSLVAVPLTHAQAAGGLLLGLNKHDGEFDSVDLKLLKSVGNQASVFVANHRLYGQLEELLMGVLHVLTASIDAKDPYTRGHSQRVALISRKLAQLCQLDPQRVHTIYLSGLLHDIGKIGVPESVLCKAGRLTEQEYASIKQHPAIGARILSNIRQMQAVMPGVLYHHERLDGLGYPEGLTGADVPLEGLIVGLADCFDAMTSSRTYRRCLPLESVVAEIMRCSGTQFAPHLVDRLLSLDLPAFLREIRRDEPAAMAIGGAIQAGPGPGFPDAAAAGNEVMPGIDR